MVEEREGSRQNRETPRFEAFEGGVYRWSRTVLPTFLSKVRACTVGRRPDFRPRRAVTVAGLCRNRTGFATTRRAV